MEGPTSGDAQPPQHLNCPPPPPPGERGGEGGGQLAPRHPRAAAPERAAEPRVPPAHRLPGPGVPGLLQLQPADEEGRDAGQAPGGVQGRGGVRRS